MKKIKTLLLFLVLSGVSLTAQNHFKPNLTILNNSGELKSGLDTLNILAIMVQFQPDLYDATVGNGTFGSVYSEQTASRTDIIDPLPHDKVYFENHLEFVKNYYEKNSDGKLYVNYTVADNIVTLDNTMRVYSPEVGSDDFSGIVNLAQESWQKFSAQNPNFDFSQYDIFVVFHAGVGRDVSLPGSLGLERDIPSVYLSLNSMRYYFGNTFDGIEVGNNFKIKNSAILPETESRESATIVGTALYQLTINGLAVSMVGSYLGLPDLYNTETGYSAIGRFGLMDGQSIFAYGGAFPPAPSPIEKMWLGWIEPKEIYLKDTKVDLTTYAKAQAGDTTLVKIPINSSEYFLIENRERDADNNGAVITYKLGNRSHTIVLSNDTTGFNNYDIDTLRGVVTDVDEFDWALPGKGIVIWHIDENVINANRASNTINNDKTHKGVAVMEADGIFDIGEIFTTIFGDTFVGEGEQNDFWFNGNTGHYFTDAFTPDSKPSSDSYSGANSGIYITGFSSVSNKMSFDLKFNFNEFRLEKVISLPQIGKVDFVNAAPSRGAGIFTVQSEKTVYVYNSEGTLINTLNNFSETPNIVLKSSMPYIVGNVGNKINIFSINGNSTKRDSFRVRGNLTSRITGPVDSIPYFFFAVESNGNFRIYHVGYSTGVVDTSSFGVPDNITQILTTLHSLWGIGEKSLYDISSMSSTDGYPQFQSENNIIEGAFADVSNPNGDELSKIILLEKNNLVEVVSAGTYEKYASFKLEGNEQITDFSLVDLGDDVYPYINYSADGKNYFYNLEGVLSDYSPLEDENGENYLGSGISFTPKGENAHILNSTSDGRLFFFDKDKMSSRLSPFFSLGSSLVQPPIFFMDNDSTKIVAADNSGKIYLFNYPQKFSLVKPYWSGKYSDGANNMYFNLMRSSSSVDNNFKLVNAYNWPNPVYGNTTNFRFKVTEDSEIKIIIFDMAGTKVAELNGRASKDMDNEIAWDVSSVQSDVYFANFQATGINSNITESKLIKVVVVK